MIRQRGSGRAGCHGLSRSLADLTAQAQQLRQLAKFTGIRRASSRVSSLAAERRPGSSSK
jgi:hypothetical protein